MKTMTLKEFLAALKAQGVPSPKQAFLVCPMCGTLQSADDLIHAGAGATFDEVEKYLGCGFRSKVTRRFGNKLPGISGQSYHVFRWKVTTFDG